MTPQVHTMAVGGKYRPLYKLDPSERNWRMLKRDGCFVECSTSGQALAAARAHVEEIQKPALLLEDEDDLGAAEWQAGKASRHEAEKRRAFGNTRPTTVFVKGGKQVPVAYRRARP